MSESVVEAPPRNLRLRPEVIRDLALQRAQLHHWVKRAQLSADDASTAYAAVLAQVVRDPACMVLDDRTFTAVKCRRCGRETSVPLEIDHYACICTPYTKRFLAHDMIGLDGEYAIDPNALPVNA